MFIYFIADVVLIFGLNFMTFLALQDHHKILGIAIALYVLIAMGIVYANRYSFATMNGVSNILLCMRLSAMIITILALVFA